MIGWGGVGGIGSYPLMEFAHYSNIIIYLITISPELQYYLHTTYTQGCSQEGRQSPSPSLICKNKNKKRAEREEETQNTM